jgi:hypothetical protein
MIYLGLSSRFKRYALTPLVPVTSHYYRSETLGVHSTQGLGSRIHICTSSNSSSRSSISRTPGETHAKAVQGNKEVGTCQVLDKGKCHSASRVGHCRIQHHSRHTFIWKPLRQPQTLRVTRCTRLASKQVREAETQVSWGEK